LDEEMLTYAAAVAQENGFFSCILAQFAEAGTSKALHLLEKSVINMI
jgi:hypothetical protein